MKSVLTVRNLIEPELTPRHVYLACEKLLTLDLHDTSEFGIQRQCEPYIVTIGLDPYSILSRINMSWILHSVNSHRTISTFSIKRLMKAAKTLIGSRRDINITNDDVRDWVRHIRDWLLAFGNDDLSIEDWVNDSHTIKIICEYYNVTREDCSEGDIFRLLDSVIKAPPYLIMQAIIEYKGNNISIAHDCVCNSPHN